jgi:3-hydroxy-9,10-secoandrosta-1,3,5(10)-triene-9,17-dione monooxygenase
MTMRFAPMAHLRSTQPTSHLQAYSAADTLDAAVARGEQVSYRMRTEIRAQAGYAAHQVLEAIQILVNVHGAGSFAESSPMQQFWRDANTAAGTPR